MTAIAAARVEPLAADTRGFDTNLALSAETAQAFKAMGYDFVGRYVRRLADATPSPNDLSASELDGLLDAGLGVIPIQHVESESAWIPSPAKGVQYGAGAVRACTELLIPRGAMVVCDLEGVIPAVSATEVDGYCRAWFAAVRSAGYVPALYVGWRAGLNAEQLFQLPFERYAAAYNLDSDQYPAVRGCCLHQRSARASDLPPGAPLRADQIDLQIAVDDALDGTAVALMPGVIA
jgi:Rv2525c-like, glycoside hydrolase-like domain